jgi:hypothetical protein
MRQIVKNSGDTSFRGSVENREDLLAASMIAGDCSVYSIDEDDEDYCEGVKTCFNCRYRRWLADGFLCVKGLLENTNVEYAT